MLIGGGVGIAELYPVACAMHNAGNHLITIIGSRTKDLLFLEHELRQLSGEFLIATDDGSCGVKGFVTDILKRVLDTPAARKQYGLVYAVGPIPMMQHVSQIVAQVGIPVTVSLNALMVDGTGMCGCCRVSVAGKLQFSCVDGPEFDGATVDWRELETRNRVYEDKEKHICKLNNRHGE
jgi:ferredoxin--NADP+ reductase